MPCCLQVKDYLANPSAFASAAPAAGAGTAAAKEEAKVIFVELSFTALCLVHIKQVLAGWLAVIPAFFMLILFLWRWSRCLLCNTAGQVDEGFFHACLVPMAPLAMLLALQAPEPEEEEEEEMGFDLFD